MSQFWPLAHGLFGKRQNVWKARTLSAVLLNRSPAAYFLLLSACVTFRQEPRPMPSCTNRCLLMG